MSELVALAVEIRREYEAVVAGVRATVEAAIRCGQLLQEAKAQIPHGGWATWLAQNFPASSRTAQNYMRLADQYPNAQLPADLTIDGALKQIAAPRQATSTAEDDDPPTPYAEFDAEVWFSFTEAQRRHLHNLAESTTARAEELEHRARANPGISTLLQAESDVVRADGKCEVFAYAVLHLLEQAPEGEEASRLRGRAHKVLADLEWAAA